MGDHQQGARPRMPALLQVLGEPVDGAHIKVVGRLVQHKHVIGANKQASQVDAAALATGELAHLALPGNVGDKAVQNLADARRRRPFVLGHIAHHRMVHGVVRIQRIALAEQANVDVATVRHTALIGFERSGENGKQRGLAVAVGAHDADAVALVHAQRDATQDKLGGKLQMNRVAPQQNRHVYHLPSARAQTGGAHDHFQPFILAGTQGCWRRRERSVPNRDIAMRRPGA